MSTQLRKSISCVKTTRNSISCVHLTSEVDWMPTGSLRSRIYVWSQLREQISWKLNLRSRFHMYSQLRNPIVCVNSASKIHFMWNTPCRHEHAGRNYYLIEPPRCRKQEYGRPLSRVWQAFRMNVPISTWTRNECSSSPGILFCAFQHRPTTQTIRT